MKSEKEKAAECVKKVCHEAMVRGGACDCGSCGQKLYLAGDKSGYARAEVEIVTAVCDAVSNCGVCPIYGSFCCGLDGKGHGKCPSKRDKHPKEKAQNGNQK